MTRKQKGSTAGSSGKAGPTAGREQREMRPHGTTDDEAAALYRAIFQRSVDTIVIATLDGWILDYNTVAYENLGYTREEFCRLHIRDVDAVENPQEVAEHLAAVVSAGWGRFETKHRTKNGELRDVLVSAQIIATGGKRFVVAIWHDITEEKRATEALAQKNAALLELLAQVQQAKDEIGRQIRANLDKVIMPALDELQRHCPAQQQRIDMLTESLEQITAPFAARLSRGVEALTPVEIRMCRLIRSGMSTKAIARLQHLSPATVSKHRENIRHKLGIQGKKVNLASHLEALLGDGGNGD